MLAAVKLAWPPWSKRRNPLGQQLFGGCGRIFDITVAALSATCYGPHEVARYASEPTTQQWRKTSKPHRISPSSLLVEKRNL
jgi:hypothetical protein